MDKHYHVLVGVPGYMPNSNYLCQSLVEAGDTAYEEAKAFRNAGYHSDWGEDCLGKVVGNKQDGYEVLRPSSGDGPQWDVWQTIRITVCHESDCLEEDYRRDVESCIERMFYAESKVDIIRIASELMRIDRHHQIGRIG